jgi:hypothetical protein
MSTAKILLVGGALFLISTGWAQAQTPNCEIKTLKDGKYRCCKVTKTDFDCNKDDQYNKGKCLATAAKTSTTTTCEPISDKEAKDDKSAGKDAKAGSKDDKSTGKDAKAGSKDGKSGSTPTGSSNTKTANTGSKPGATGSKPSGSGSSTSKPGSSSAKSGNSSSKTSGSGSKTSGNNKPAGSGSAKN